MQLGRMVRTAGLSACGLVVPLVLGAQAERPAVRRARELIAIINDANVATMRAYADTAYHESMHEPDELEADLGLEGGVTRFLFNQRERARRLTLLSIDTTTPERRADVEVRAAVTGVTSRLVVVVERAAPFRIVGLGDGHSARAAVIPRAEQIHEDAALVRRAERLVTQMAAADQFSGVILLARNGRVLLQRAYGFADRAAGVPNTTSTRFDLASVTKMFTAVAVAQLMEQGKLSFNDPLSRFLPAFPSAEAAQRIQLEHLLSHTSGLDDFYPRDTLSRRPNLFRTVGSRMAVAHVDSLQFAPGTGWNYSNMGYIALGRVIEVASGQDFYDYLQTRVFAAAGMQHTGFPELDRVPRGLARGYESEYAPDGTKEYRERFGEGVRGGPESGAYSTAEDLLRFVEALRAGRLVTVVTLATISSPKPELHAPRYGFGFQVDSAAGSYGHTGGIPGGSTSVDLFREGGYVLILLANGGIGQRDNVRFDLQELVRRRVAALPE